MASIEPADISDDRDLGLRVLAYVRPVAPCLQSLADDHDRETAIAILKQLARTVQAHTAGLKSRAAGDWSWTYMSDAEMGGYLGVDDRAALRALCGTPTGAGGGPVGSFPTPVDYSRVFR